MTRYLILSPRRKSEQANWKPLNSGANSLARKESMLKVSGVTKTACATGASLRSPNSDLVLSATTDTGRTPRRSAACTESSFSSKKKTPSFLPPDSRPPSTSVSKLMLFSSTTTTLRTCPSTRSLRLTTTKLGAFWPWPRTLRDSVESHPLTPPPFLTKSTSTSQRRWTESSSTSISATRAPASSLESSTFLRPLLRRKLLTLEWSASLLTTSLSSSPNTAARLSRSRMRLFAPNRISARSAMKLLSRTSSTPTSPRLWRLTNSSRSKPLASLKPPTSSRKPGSTRLRRLSSLASLLRITTELVLDLALLLGSTLTRWTEKPTSRVNLRNS